MSATENNFISVDPNTQACFKLAKQVSASDASVLIIGESGVGKEVLARYIHEQSSRAKGPFVAINCAAIPENMLEGILFGHEKGAFTGAIQSSEGKFEQANGGTILLDEISEMPLMLQAKLLRVLQEKEVERLGSKHSVKLNIRILATSNRDLKECVRSKQFREDLFYRLSVFPIVVPPLRVRTQDILPLAHLFVGHPIPISASAIQKLQEHIWPGNIRELNNVMQRAHILSDKKMIQAEDIKFDQIEILRGENSNASTLYDNLKFSESEIIIQALKDNKGSRKNTAKQLGISPRTLRYKIADLKSQGMDIPPRSA